MSEKYNSSINPIFAVLGVLMSAKFSTMYIKKVPFVKG